VLLFVFDMRKVLISIKVFIINVIFQNYIPHNFKNGNTKELIKAVEMSNIIWKM